MLNSKFINIFFWNFLFKENTHLRLDTDALLKLEHSLKLFTEVMSRMNEKTKPLPPPSGPFEIDFGDETTSSAQDEPEIQINSFWNLFSPYTGKYCIEQNKVKLLIKLYLI